MGEVDGKVALVTGAAGGIGRATATLFGAEGASVALLDVNGAGATTIAERISSEHGVETIVIGADLTKVAAIEDAFGQTLDRFGRVDAVANVAAIYPAASVVDTDEAFWDQVMDLNLRSVFFCCREAMRAMSERGGGSIVNVAAGAAFVGTRGLAVYSASKSGLLGMSRVMALEGARRGVRVNIVAPGPTVTETTLQSLTEEERLAQARRLPAGRHMQPEEVAEAIVFLCSDRASGINGDIINVNAASYTSDG